MEYERISQPSRADTERARTGRQKNYGKAQKNSAVGQFLRAVDEEPNQWMVLKRRPLDEGSNLTNLKAMLAQRIHLERRYLHHEWEVGSDNAGLYIAARTRARARASGAEAWLEENWQPVFNGLNDHLRYLVALLSTAVTDNQMDAVHRLVDEINKLKEAIKWMEERETECS